MNRHNLFGLWFLLFFLAVATGALSQLKQPYRFEQEMKNSEDGFRVIPLQNEGLAFIRDLDKYAHGDKKWQLEIVDTTLSKIWSTELELDSRLILVGYEYSPGHLYLLFREGQTTFFNFQLLTVLYYEKYFQIIKIPFDLEFRLTHFTIAGSSAVFGGYVNSEPAVLLYDFASDHPKVLPGLFTTDVALLDMRTNQNQSFNVLLAERKGKEKMRLIMRTFDHDANLLIDDFIDIDPRFSILSGLTSTLEREEMIIVGTYGEGNGKQALGLFSTTVDPFNEQAVTYTDFSSLEHFLDYLPEKKSGKIKTKAQKQKSLGRLPDYKANVFPFRLEERPTGFYLLTEMYYQSSTVNSPYYYPYYYNFYSPYAFSNFQGRPTPYTNRYYNQPYIYDNPVRNSSEVRMLQTLVVKLGDHGKVEKDVSMRLEDIKQPILEQVGDFLILKDSIVLAYKKENEIFYQKEVGDSEEKPLVKQSKVNLRGPNDALKKEDEDQGGVRFWYGNHFYVWGYQRIQGTTEEGEQTRFVFYVNRIDLE